MDVSDLRGAAAKLLLHLLLNPGTERSMTALMKAIGTTDKKTYYDAKRQLDARNLIDGDGNPTSEVLDAVNHTSEGGKNLPDGETIPLSLLERAYTVDESSMYGDKQDPNSPFNVRRRAQVALIIEAINTYLPRPNGVSTNEALDLLVMAGNKAATVYEEVVKVRDWCEAQVAKGRTSQSQTAVPLIRKFLSTRIKEDAERAREEAAYDEELPPAPPELIAKLEARKRELIQSGRFTEEDFEQ